MNEKTMTIARMEAPAQLPVRKRVAAYARVSMEKDAMLHSLAAQVSYYSERIQQNPKWEYAGVFADFGLTGTKETRPEFQRMLKECREGKIDLILVKSISRFARNTLALLNTVRELKGLGIGVYFEEQKLDTLSGDGEFMLTIHMAKELMEDNYMHALLRATLLLGDLHRQIPVREITIAGFLIQNHARRLYPRCKMVAQTAEEAASPISPETAGEDYLILYPVYPPLCFS